MRYKRQGWFKESARHSLAAKGVRTSFYLKKPGKDKPWPWDLPEGDPRRQIRMKELEDIEVIKTKKDKPEGVPIQWADKPVPEGKIKNILLKPEITEDEREIIKDHFGEEKGEEILRQHEEYWKKRIEEKKSSFALFKKDDPDRPSVFEAFKSPEEKSDVGKGMMQRIIDNKTADVEARMNNMSLSFEDKRRIMDHHVYPVIQRFKNGNISEEQFNDEVDSKVDHNAKMNDKDLRIFGWAEADETDGRGKGTFNFIDRASASKSFAAKDPRTKKLTLGDRIFGFGVIGNAMTIEHMQKDSTYYKKKK